MNQLFLIGKILFSSTAILTAVFFASCTTAPSLAPTDAVLAAYAEGTREPAATAVKMREQLVRAHLNIAGVLSTARNKAGGSACSGDVEAYEGEIQDSLRKAWQHADENAGLINSLMPKSVRHAMSHSITLKEITGQIDVRDFKTYEKAFEGAKFWAQGQGAYGPGIYFSLLPGGRLEWTRLEVTDTDVERKQFTGTWKVVVHDSRPKLLVKIDGYIGGNGNKTLLYGIFSTCSLGSCGWVLSKPLKSSETYNPEAHTVFWNWQTSECDA